MAGKHSCPNCYGTGAVPGQEVCPECLGTPESNCDGISVTCEDCGGTGRKRVPCSCCE